MKIQFESQTILFTSYLKRNFTEVNVEFHLTWIILLVVFEIR